MNGRDFETNVKEIGKRLRKAGVLVRKAKLGYKPYLQYDFGRPEAKAVLGYDAFASYDAYVCIDVDPGAGVPTKVSVAQMEGDDLAAGLLAFDPGAVRCPVLDQDGLIGMVYDGVSAECDGWDGALKWIMAVAVWSAGLARRR